MGGIFTISLDFELHWGVFDKKDRQSRERCYRNTRTLIPQMLDLFVQHGVHATWATVGSLMAKDAEEWESLRPGNEPAYAVEAYSPYHWVRQNGLAKEFYWAHFAPHEVEDILRCEGQELGTHTFGHYYCLEQCSGEDAFDADLKAAKKAAGKFGSQPVSLVFPRNQFNPYHLSICYANGIRAVRSNPAQWFWSPTTDSGANVLRKIFRTGDAYLPLSTRRNSYPLNAIQSIPGQPLQLPASRLFRPWNPRLPFLNRLALRRCCNELVSAAWHHECYHLWWHPENFGEHPQENLKQLKKALQQFRWCQQNFGMQSWHMGEYVANLCREPQAVSAQREWV